jgi:hypothetical protein
LTRTAGVGRPLRVPEHAQQQTGTAPADAAKRTDKRAAASAAGWVLGTSNAWTDKYFNPDDLHFADPELFGT